MTDLIDALKTATITEERAGYYGSELSFKLGHLTGRAITSDGTLICTVNGSLVAEKYFGFDGKGIENYGRVVVTRKLREIANKLIAERAAGII